MGERNNPALPDLHEAVLDSSLQLMYVDGWLRFMVYP